MIRTANTPTRCATLPHRTSQLCASPWLIAITTIASTIALPVAAIAQSKPSSAPTPSNIPLEINGQPIELASLGGIYLTSTGAIVFADTKPVTVRIREGRNGSIKQIARAGAGPGEFRQTPGFVGFNGDSIAAFDPGLRRWSIFSANGAFVRVLGTGPEAETYSTAAAWITDGALVFNATLDKTRAPLAAVLTLIVADSPNNNAPIVIRQASNGDLWSAPSVSSKMWTVYDRAGRRRTNYAFPTPFRFAAANDTVAIGQTVDEDDLPQIMRLPLRPVAVATRKTSATNSASGTVDATDAERASAKKALVALMRAMVGRQEAAYSDSGRYVMTVRALKSEFPAEYYVQILDADNRGWFGIARDAKARVTCAIGVGYSLVIGWGEGIPYCSQ